MSAEWIDFLRAIEEALDLPQADTPAGDRDRHRLLNLRTRDVRVMTTHLLLGAPVDDAEIANATRQLRKWTAQNPADYPRWSPEVA